jgi:hypothetical protein
LSDRLGVRGGWREDADDNGDGGCSGDQSGAFEELPTGKHCKLVWNRDRLDQ